MSDREEVLEVALRFALGEMQDMVGYVPEYQRHKWNYDGAIQMVSDAVEGKRVPEFEEES